MHLGITLPQTLFPLLLEGDVLCLSPILDEEMTEEVMSQSGSISWWHLGKMGRELQSLPDLGYDPDWYRLFGLTGEHPETQIYRGGCGMATLRLDSLCDAMRDSLSLGRVYYMLHGLYSQGLLDLYHFITSTHCNVYWDEADSD